MAVIDQKHGQFLLVDVGWDNGERVHAVVIHLRLSEGKIIIEHDGILDGIGLELLDAGVPEEDIVVAFMPVHHPVKENLAA